MLNKFLLKFFLANVHVLNELILERLFINALKFWIYHKSRRQGRCTKVPFMEFLRLNIHRMGKLLMLNNNLCGIIEFKVLAYLMESSGMLKTNFLVAWKGLRHLWQFEARPRVQLLFPFQQRALEQSVLDCRSLARITQAPPLLLKKVHHHRPFEWLILRARRNFWSRIYRHQCRNTCRGPHPGLASGGRRT